MPVPRSTAPAVRAANVNNSFAFGLNHVTQVFKDGVFDGFEMTCHHPDHKTGSKKCRKHLKAVTRSRDGSSDVADAESLGCLGCQGSHKGAACQCLEESRESPARWHFARDGRSSHVVQESEP